MTITIALKTSAALTLVCADGLGGQFLLLVGRQLDDPHDLVDAGIDAARIVVCLEARPGFAGR